MPLIVVGAVAAVWIGAAVVIARRRSAHVLWARAVVILAAAYLGGTLIGWWPLTAARPLLDIITTWLGG